MTLSDKSGGKAPRLAATPVLNRSMSSARRVVRCTELSLAKISDSVVGRGVSYAVVFDDMESLTVPSWHYLSSVLPWAKCLLSLSAGATSLGW